MFFEVLRSTYHSPIAYLCYPFTASGSSRTRCGSFCVGVLDVVEGVQRARRIRIEPRETWPRVADDRKKVGVS